jgi:hypothetical protein
MRRRYQLLVFIVLLCSLFLINWSSHSTLTLSQRLEIAQPARYWQVQSIDTMKMSRDGAQGSQNQNDISNEVKAIAEVGATHVAVGVPYDDEFASGTMGAGGPQ